MSDQAFRFLQEAANKPEWASTITDGGPEEIVALARDHGYECDLDDLKRVAGEIIQGTDEPREVSEGEIEEAAGGAVAFDQRGGYGSDSGFALMSGLAAALLRK